MNKKTKKKLLIKNQQNKRKQKKIIMNIVFALLCSVDEGMFLSWLKWLVIE